MSSDCYGQCSESSYPCLFLFSTVLEEVLLHDGSTIVVDRSVERGGRHELGQPPPFKEQSLRFTVPVTSQKLTWEDHFSEDLGSANFLPMLLDIVKETPYLVASPMGCLAYNKWGRPNPPYVIFKYNGREWQRIPLEELPSVINTPNLIISDPDNKVKELGKSFATASDVKNANTGFRQPEYRTILREAVKGGEGLTSCPDYNSERYRSPKAPLPMKPLNDPQGKQ